MAAAALTFVGGWIARWWHVHRIVHGIPGHRAVSERGVVTRRINELRCSCGRVFWRRRLNGGLSRSQWEGGEK